MTGKKCTKNYNARAPPLFCSKNLLFSDVPVAVAVDVFFLTPYWLCTVTSCPISVWKSILSGALIFFQSNRNSRIVQLFYFSQPLKMEVLIPKRNALAVQLLTNGSTPTQLCITSVLNVLCCNLCEQYTLISETCSVRKKWEVEKFNQKRCTKKLLKMQWSYLGA